MRMTRSEPDIIPHRGSAPGSGSACAGFGGHGSGCGPSCGPRRLSCRARTRAKPATGRVSVCVFSLKRSPSRASRARPGWCRDHAQRGRRGVAGRTQLANRRAAFRAPGMRCRCRRGTVSAVCRSGGGRRGPGVCAGPDSPATRRGAATGSCRRRARENCVACQRVRYGVHHARTACGRRLERPPPQPLSVAHMR